MILKDCELPELLEWDKQIEEIFIDADKSQTKAAEANVKAHSFRFPLQRYKVGDKLMVNLPLQGKKIKAKGKIFTSYIILATQTAHKAKNQLM